MGRTVVPIGDSLTKYPGWRQALVDDWAEPDSSWPGRTSLTLLGPETDSAGGYLAADSRTIEQMTPLVAAYAAVQPFDIGAVLAGTNNLVGHVGEGASGALAPVQAYGKLLAALVNASRVPLIITVPPAPLDPALSDAFNDGLAAGYNGLVAKGYAAIFADTRDLIGVDDIGPDHWHPKPPVYQTIGAAVYRALHMFTAGLRPPAVPHLAAPRTKGVPLDPHSLITYGAPNPPQNSGSGFILALALGGTLWAMFER